MSKRGGLGQRGLDLLISVSPAAAENKDKNIAEEEKPVKVKTEKGKTGKQIGTGTDTAKQTAGKRSSGKGSTKSESAGRKHTDDAAGEKSTAQTESSLKKKEVRKAASTKKNTVSPENAEVPEVGGSALEISVNTIEPNRDQPRRTFDEDSLQELADSIKQYGIIEPLVVQKKDDYYEIIAGERRWRAAKIAGLKTVPVIIKDYTPREVMELSLIENIQREDLNPIEEANAYRRLMEEYNLRQDEVAERVSKSRAAVANAVRLLNLDKRVQNMVVSDMITTGHARALLAITDPDLQYSTAQRVFDEKMSVRDVEKLVKQLTSPRQDVHRKTLSDTLQAVYDGMTERMKTSLGTKVSIHPKSSQKGKIEIEYYSADELDRIYSMLLHSGSKTGGDAGAELISE